MKALGVLLIILGISMIIGYLGHLLKKNSKEQNLSKVIIIVGEWVSFSPFTIGLMLMGVGLLLILNKS